MHYNLHTYTNMRSYVRTYIHRIVSHIYEHCLDIFFQKLHEDGRVQQRLRLLEEICLVHRSPTYKLVNAAMVIRFDYQ
jgi:hypothetical protein